LVVFAIPMLDKLKIDDVVGAIPVHGFAGIWGTFAVVLTGGYHGETALGTQILGMVAIIGTTFVLSLIVWFILKAVMGIRVSEEAELEGLDVSELGMEAYPDFTKG
jgi:Amt family ammonium transporter